MSINATRRSQVASLQNEVVMLIGRFTGGGAAADMTKVSGTCKGITSCAYNAATGAYKLTLDGVAGTFLGGSFNVLTGGSTAAQNVVNPIAYSASAKTLTIFITDVATPTAQDLTTGEELWVVLYFAASSAP